MSTNQFTALEIVMLLRAYAHRFEEFAGTHTIGGAYKEYDQEFVSELEQQIQNMARLIQPLRTAVDGE